MSTLRDEFAAILTQYGHYVVHVHKTPLVCPSCSTRFGGDGLEQSPRCPRCLGRGRLVQVHPCRVRGSSPWRPNPDALEDTPMGVTQSGTRIYYFHWDDTPDEGDLILEVTWSVPAERVPTHGQVLAVHRVYEVNSVQPARGVGGEVVYHRTAAQSLDIDVAWITDRLKHRPVPGTPGR